MTKTTCKYKETCQKHKEKYESLICFNPLIPLGIGCSIYDAYCKEVKQSRKESKDETDEVKQEEVYFFELKKMARRFKVNEREIILCAQEQGYSVLFPSRKQAKIIKRNRGA